MANQPSTQGPRAPKYKSEEPTPYNSEAIFCGKLSLDPLISGMLNQDFEISHSAYAD
jgi:hypothetical protein